MASWILLGQLEERAARITADGLTVGTGWLVSSSCCCSSSASSSSPWVAAVREAKLVYNNIIIHLSKLNTYTQAYLPTDKMHLDTFLRIPKQSSQLVEVLRICWSKELTQSILADFSNLHHLFQSTLPVIRYKQANFLKFFGL